jgi:hypothetical protein
MRRRMARGKKKVDPFEFRGSDEESDDEDKLSAKRKGRNSGNSTPHSLRGSHAGGSSPCSDVDGDRPNCRARLSFSGSDEGEQGDTAASGPGSAEQSDEGDDEQSGLGSTDDDDKIPRSICAWEILEDSEIITGCGHHVCEFCHQDALEHLDHVKGNPDLEEAMMEFCGLSHRVCLRAWPHEIVFPKRVIALRGVTLSSKNRTYLPLPLTYLPLRSLRTQSRSLSPESARTRKTDNRVAQLSVSLYLSARCVRSDTLHRDRARRRVEKQRTSIFVRHMNTMNTYVLFLTSRRLEEQSCTA